MNEHSEPFEAIGIPATGYGDVLYLLVCVVLTRFCFLFPYYDVVSAVIQTESIEMRNRANLSF